jgi:hypothetical protein
MKRQLSNLGQRLWVHPRPHVAAEANMGLPMLSALARGRSHNIGASATDEAVIE